MNVARPILAGAPAQLEFADMPAAGPGAARRLTHLQQLEAESIHIIREAAAESSNPVLLYSIGKDSSVLLHLALKAFYPARLPFPLLHIDTTWKFRDMIAFRDSRAKELGVKLIVHVNQDGIGRGVGPLSHPELHTDVMKTQALRQALDRYGFDVALGGARRDEERSRAKERVFSLRSAQHRWDPKRQRAEPWRLYNTRKRKGESFRVFPLSNWTELDVWLYIHWQRIPVVPLYFAAPRPVVSRNGTLIMVDDDRLPLEKGERPEIKTVRFRTLGCYPLTGGIESDATTLGAVIRETAENRVSERSGRLIDQDGAAAMERKKQEGYF
jgi:sulfate adenylyltransferase subunit 2